MKKQLLLLAGAAVMFASCGGGNTEDQGMTQAQQDSAVNARVAEREAELARQNEEKLRAMEAEKAKQAASTKTTTKKEEPKAEPVEPPPPPPPPPAAAEPANPKAARFEKKEEGSTQSKVPQSATDKKADRFKR